MSEFSWGKIKFSKLQSKIENFHWKNEVLVFFSDNKNDLFLDDLEENEVYFNIAGGYADFVTPEKYGMKYLNYKEDFFSLRNLPTKKTKTFTIEPYIKEIQDRVCLVQEVLEKMYSMPNVEKISFYHTGTGSNFDLSEYEKVDWKLSEFAKKINKYMQNHYGFTPTFRVIFKK